MTDIHYFQRYSQKENLITNNALLLLSRLYAHSPLRLESFLAELLDTKVDVGLSFQQQTSSTGGSVPDGDLRQPSFRLVIETKRGRRPRMDQIREHLKQFSQDDQKCLLVLLGAKPSTETTQEFESIINEYNQNETGSGVTGRLCTFRELINTVQNNVEAHEMELVELIEDFEDFCAQEDLLPREAVRMRAEPCGNTLEDNLQWNIYWEKGQRAKRGYRFFAIYSDKAIRGIGKVENRVTAEWENGDVAVAKARHSVSEDQLGRIRQAMERNPGIRTEYDFLLVEEFIPTEYRKESKHGMRGTRYFDLDEVLEVEESGLPSVEEVADRLEEKIW